MEGALFGLLGLLIAFTFSGAAGRFQSRRELITSETNTIGTAWLRLDLLPAAVQPSARESMRQYVDARASGEQAWDKFVFPALNEMFDIGTLRTHALLWHPPAIVFVLLSALAPACSLLAGFAMAGAVQRPRLHMLTFAAIIAVTVYVIADLELPRQGLFRVVGDDQRLIDLRADMR